MPRLALAVLIAACAGAPPVRPQHRPTLAILGLEPIAGDDAAATAARRLTAQLRAEAGSTRSRFVLAPNKEREQLEMKELASCKNDAPSCMAEIGADLEVDFMIYGTLERRAAGFTLTLDLMDVGKRTNRRALVEVVAPDHDPAATARDAYIKLGANR